MAYFASLCVVVTAQNTRETARVHNPNVHTNHTVIYVRLAQLFKGDRFPPLHQVYEKKEKLEMPLFYYTILL
jgi:hypothetical protein